MTIGVAHCVGILAVLVLIAGVGAWSGRKVSSASDFTTGGGRAGTMVVAGSIMGTLVSGQATVGTAQLAFNYGLSAWWFTLGSGVGCLILALVYVVRMRATDSTTLVGVVVAEYGEKIDFAASVFSAIGIFISVIAQMISASALITTLFPMPDLLAIIISGVIMAVYVIFGGVWGAGIGGVVKLVLLYAACIVGAAVVLMLGGGPAGIMETLTSVLAGTDLGAATGIASAADIPGRFLSLVARGPLNDLGSGLSLVLGVISTQSYASAVWAAKSDAAARKGALLSAGLIPPIGIACILIGLFMRGVCLTADEAAALAAAGQAVPEGMFVIASTAQVFPQFVVHYLPELVGGVVLGTLFVTVVGGGAGLSLGVATVVVEDLIEHAISHFATATRKLAFTRMIIIVVLVLAGAAALLLPGSMINDFGFLSMGLRGAVIFIPLTFALFAPGRVGGGWALASVIAGPVAVMVGNVVGLPFDPLFVGVAVSLAVMAAGYAIHRRVAEESDAGQASPVEAGQASPVRCASTREKG